MPKSETTAKIAKIYKKKRKIKNIFRYHSKHELNCHIKKKNYVVFLYPAYESATLVYDENSMVC